jgi:hypothetical protein
MQTGGRFETQTSGRFACNSLAGIRRNSVAVCVQIRRHSTFRQLTSENEQQATAPRRIVESSLCVQGTIRHDRIKVVRYIATKGEQQEMAVSNHTRIKSP